MVSILLPSYVQAEDTEDIIKILDSIKEIIQKEKDGKCVEWRERFILASNFLEQKELERRKLNLNVGLGYNGNKAEGGDSLYKKHEEFKLKLEIKF